MNAPRIAAGVLISVALLTAGCQHPLARAAADTTVTVESGGQQRQFLVHLPAGHSGGGKLPAVLVFHGGGGTAQGMADMTGFDRLADQDGFVAVYPTGYEKSWNDGRGGDTRAGAAGIDDLGFVATVIDRIVADDNVDPERVSATGLSNGAMFTEYLGCRLSDRLAAIAPVAGELPVADQSGCAPSHPMPVLEIHGTADPIVPYGGGDVRVTSGHLGGAGTSPVLSVDDTQQLWRGKDGCGAVVSTPLPAHGDDGTSVSVQSADCANNGKVELYSITGGGHTWPDGPQYLPRAIVGTASHQFDGSAVIWDFLSAYHR